MIHLEKTGSIILDYIKTYMFFELGFDLAFKELGDYQELMEGFLDNRKEKLNEDLNKEYEMHIIEEQVDKILELNDVFSNNFRKSFFIQIYSFIELELKQICLYHHKVKTTKYSIKDLKGNSDVMKGKLYLKKSCKINITQFPEWNFIDNVREIRNKIVHHNGIIRSDDVKLKKIKAFCKQHQFIEVIEETQYLINEEPKSYEIRIINKNANEALLKKTKSFFKRLLNEEKLKELIL